MKRLFTSESVTEGHPDKICDMISDSILDNILKKDPQARVACETAITTGMVLVMGEITTSCYVDIKKIVRDTIRSIGYTSDEMGFNADTCAVIVALDEQSEDIKFSVDNATDESDEIGAGDQGMMIGFACDETLELMPLPILLAHKLSKRLTQVRKDGILDYLYPDGKTQVTIEYENDVPKRVDTIVISSQHHEQVSLDTIQVDIKKYVIDEIIPDYLIDDETHIYINPSGRFVIGGPVGDSGLTGRKIIVDTYGGYAAHGGGAFSGKDATKVDRSGAYAARYIAKNLVASKVVTKCEIEISYAIGLSKPISVYINTFNTNVIQQEEIECIISEVFDLTPNGIIKNLDLRKPIFSQTASYGHFGRNDIDLPWERTDKVEEIRKLANNCLS